MEPVDKAQALDVMTQDDPYLVGKFRPIQDEIVAEDLHVKGELPRDLEGMFLRNSPNPRFPPKGKYHWFDGDGMIHGVLIRDGKATYRNRYIQTAGLKLEEKAGHALYTGINERPNRGLPDGPFKNTANTDLRYHNGRLLALWWLGGDAYQVRVPDLETLGIPEFCSRLACGIASHPKVDPATGDMMFFDYAMTPPFMSYGVINARGEVVHQTPIELPGARLQHDIAFTPNYTLLFDMPMYWDPALLLQGKTKVVFNADMPARIGVIPRFGTQPRWFDAEAFYMYHTINAYEDGDEIVLTGCHIENPIPGRKDNPFRRPRLGFLELHPFLCRWRLNLKDGSVKHQILDDVPSEFPRTNETSMGRRQRFSYNPRIAAEPELLFNGLIKYDTETGRSWTCDYGPGRWGGEAAFAPRANARDEDDGYLINFLYDEGAQNSELLIIDAKDLAAGPVAAVQIPQRVPIGYHTCWVSAAELAQQRTDHVNAVA